jgi:hypothetical protein
LNDCFDEPVTHWDEGWPVVSIVPAIPVAIHLPST